MYFSIAIEILLQDLQHSLSCFDEELTEAAADQRAPLASQDWSICNALFSERWREKRPSLLNSMLAKKNVATNICSQCGNNCVAIRCRHCLPCPFLCAECDISKHSKVSVPHNRDAMCAGFFLPLSLTTCVVDKALTNCGKLHTYV